jgi:hypothetical protein
MGSIPRISFLHDRHSIPGSTLPSIHACAICFVFCSHTTRAIRTVQVRVHRRRQDSYLERRRTRVGDGAAVLGLLLAVVVHGVLADAAREALLAEPADGLVAHVARHRPRKARRVEVVHSIRLLMLSRATKRKRKVS